MAGLHLSGDPATAARYGAVSASFAIEAHGALAGLHAARMAALRRVDWLRREGHQGAGHLRNARSQPDAHPGAANRTDGGDGGTPSACRNHGG